LIFLGGEITEKTAARLEDVIYRRYQAGLAKVGANASRLRGVRLEVATTRRDAAGVLGRYLNKIALEIGRPDLKSAKVGAGGEVRWAPFAMLSAMEADRDGLLPQTRQLREVWKGLEMATKGRARVTHGSGWDELLARATAAQDVLLESGEGGPDIEDGAVPAEVPAGANVDGLVPDRIEWPNLDHYYRIIVPNWPELASIAERDGWTGAIEWMDARGVEWRWGLSTIGSVECPTGDARSAVHRAGRCECWSQARNR
jgi:hypothetical protein